MGRRGYKECGQCGEEASVRTRVCPKCETVFVSKAQKAKEATTTAETTTTEPVGGDLITPPPPPDLTPAPPSSNGCDKHPKYRAKFAPASKCKQCWEMWRIKQGHPAEKPNTTPVTVLRVNNEMEIKDFISQLKEALKNSKRTGGLYSAFICGQDADCGRDERVKVQIEVGLPLR